jgi:hypothetical protein
VPTGGGAGQILAKSTATNYDTTWINAPSAGAASPYHLGRWDKTSEFYSYPQVNRAAYAFTNDYALGIRIIIPNAITLKTVALVVTTANSDGTAVGQFYLYNVAATGGPTTRVWYHYTYALNTTGVKTSPVANQAIAAGEYWLIYRQSVTTTCSLLGTSAGHRLYNSFHAVPTSATDYTTDLRWFNAWQAAGSAPMPADITGTNMQAWTTNTQQFPVPFFSIV